LTDAKGNQKAVQIPIKDWLKIEKELNTSNFVKKLKVDLMQVMREVKQMESGHIPKQSLGDFLSEL